ncbi:MAG: aldose 1-epimerase family protein [Sphingobacterium sp.]
MKKQTYTRRKSNVKDTKKEWLELVSHHAQVGGIETSVLDNGRANGTRIAWVNTGAGLRFKVVIDRGMDISDASFNQHNLVWLSRLGVTAPQPFSDSGINWLRTFGGGLLTTCGVTHAGGPEQDAYGSRGLHDQYSNTPAELLSIKQPNLTAGDKQMSIIGKIFQGHPLGYNIEIKRTIRCVLGEPTIYLEDEITNIGNIQVPHMLLYHMNFGYPLVAPGAQILWKGEWTSREGEQRAKIFKKGENFRSCPEPMQSHSGTGEEAALIDVEADQEGIASCGINNPQLDFTLRIRFHKKQLPWLTNWQHWGTGEYVAGLEPGTHPPLGQSHARQNGDLIRLAPGESRKYSLQVDIIQDPQKRTEFVNSYINL